MRVLIFALGAFLALAGYFWLAAEKERREERPALLRPASFDDLPGWGGDAVQQAVLPLVRSCERRLRRKPDETVGPDGFGGRVQDWQAACASAAAFLFSPAETARAFFEDHFSVYQVRAGKWHREGLFTGYYEPELKGSRVQKTGYDVPLYRAPENIVTADLGLFRAEWKGKKITGRVNNGKLEPLEAREAIEKGAFAGKGLELVWVSDAIDAFFLQIQGSGRIMLDDGGQMRVGYAAANGHPYVAIGRALLERKALTKENVSMQAIRAWLASHPDEAAAVMNLNPSFVFFRELDGGALGGEGVELTAQRSLAIDAKKLPYGAPFWLDVAAPGDSGDKRIQTLVMAQDTGGAIRGAVRGDFFWGPGKTAEEKAGVMKSRGYFWILLPKGVMVPRERQAYFWWDAFFK